MEKCWFVLKQSDYPPPQIPESGFGIANGAICLGHIIPDADNLDGVINRSKEGITFTPAVSIHHMKSLSLDWKKDKGLEARLAANMAALTGADSPASAEHGMEVAFASINKDYKQFDTLDRYTIDVDREFIATVLKNKAVVEHIERTKGSWLQGGRWSVFMITGIMVARGARGESGESQKFEAMSSTKVRVADAASIGMAANFANNNATSLATKSQTDFVWAVKLTKIWKGAMDKGWEFRTVSKGATFSLDNKMPWRDEIQSALSQELSNFGAFQTIEIPEEESMIVY